jgi:uncharacterized protein YkwD
MAVKLTLLSFALLLVGLRPASGAPVPAPTSPRDGLSRHMEQLTNALRTSRGLPPVRLDPALCQAAAGHAREMAENHYFGHNRPTGRFSGLSTPGSRARAQGYCWNLIEENIACGQQTVASVFSAWVASYPHYRNLVSPQVRELGLGVARDLQTRQAYWVMLLGARDESFAPKRPGTLPEPRVYFTAI